MRMKTELKVKYYINDNETKLLWLLCLRLDYTVFEIKVLFCPHAGCIGSQNHAPCIFFHVFFLI